ncbi:MAG: hypothetical protein A2808_00165 [Candidatus Moranbacteria bacterium RIFCSPHIGHO2_01_FULL_55_24]|nr:MAG: hypothetical protein A2808_00165 [Candidatus Moranbacteria bacterium RIFCSPHIGHO2_01_FULL_55_24]
MTDTTELSEKALELIEFYDSQGCLGVSELVRWLDTEGSTVNMLGTPMYGIQYVLAECTTEEERRHIYKAYKRPLYLGTVNGRYKPIDTLDWIREQDFASLPLQNKRDFDEFCLEALQCLRGEAPLRNIVGLALITATVE